MSDVSIIPLRDPCVYYPTVAFGAKPQAEDDGSSIGLTLNPVHRDEGGGGVELKTKTKDPAEVEKKTRRKSALGTLLTQWMADNETTYQRQRPQDLEDKAGFVRLEWVRTSIKIPPYFFGEFSYQLAAFHPSLRLSVHVRTVQLL